MIPSTSKNYSLSPTMIFVVIGFILLLSVILFHGYINRSSQASWPWSLAGASQAAGNPVPEAVISEITHAGENVSAYPEYLKNASWAMKKVYEMNHPQVFITQE